MTTKKKQAKTNVTMGSAPELLLDLGDNKFAMPGAVMTIQELRIAATGNERVWLDITPEPHAGAGIHGSFIVHWAAAAGSGTVVIGPYRWVLYDRVSGDSFCMLNDHDCTVVVRRCLALAKSEMVRCDNCMQVWTLPALAHVFPNIPDLLERLDPGGTVPSGECPDCGALVYLLPPT